MPEETQQEVKERNGTVSLSKWFIALVIAGISTVFGILVTNYEKQITEGNKREALKDSMLTICQGRRYEEMTHRKDEAEQKVKQLEEEMNRRIDSLIKIKR